MNKYGKDDNLEIWTKIRLLPKIFSKNCKHFSYKDCRFRVSAEKLQTARVVAWNQFNIINSFTMETSFFGYYDEENQKNMPFTTNDLTELGKKLCESYLEYSHVCQNLDMEI